MQEDQVTVDGATYELGRPFMVIATQNPVEYEGTYPLPEAQLDRFTMRIALGYPPLADEARMLTEQTTDPPLDSLQPVVEGHEALALVGVAKARALADGRGFVEPDDVKAVAEPVLAHRLILAPEARAGGVDGRALVRDALDRTPVPL